jgi:hypothetical protein
MANKNFLKKKEKNIVYKVWLEIERYNEKTGDGEDVETLSLCDFASSAQFDTLHAAVEFCKDLDHYANN